VLVLFLVLLEKNGITFLSNKFCDDARELFFDVHNAQQETALLFFV
jgi:hypothetical protein